MTQRRLIPARARGRGARALWGIGDQVLYALSGATLTFIAAHQLAPREFGHFALLYATMAIILGICRAMTSEPFTVLHGTQGQAGQRRTIPSVLGYSIVLGLLAGLPLMVAGAALQSSSYVMFGLAAVPIVWQDAVRYVLVAQQRVKAAFVNDTAWNVVQFTGTAAVAALGELHATSLALWWALGALAGCLVGIAQLGCAPGFGRVREWWHASRKYSAYYVIEFMALAGSGYSIVYFVAWTSGLAEAGGYRGAQALFGPVTTMVGGVRMLALPAVVRRRSQGREAVVRTALVVGAGLAMITLAVSFVLWAARGLIGPMLLGATAAAAVPLILPMAIGRTAISGAAGVLLGMRALGATKGSLGTRLFVAALTVVLAVFGSMEWGGLGAAWGFAIASMVGAAAWLVALRRTPLSLVDADDGAETTDRASAGD